MASTAKAIYLLKEKYYCKNKKKLLDFHKFTKQTHLLLVRIFQTAKQLCIKITKDLS